MGCSLQVVLQTKKVGDGLERGDPLPSPGEARRGADLRRLQ